jgi:hypothetical protein
MAISLAIEKQNHEPVRRITQGFELLAEFSIHLPDACLLRGIHPYGDTIFNMVQLRLLINEVDELVKREEDHTAMLSLIKDAADQAIAVRGYLRFIGD